VCTCAPAAHQRQKLLNFSFVIAGCVEWSTCEWSCEWSTWAPRSQQSELLFITAVTITKPFASGEGDSSGGHVLRETTSRGLCGPVCPSRMSECRGKGDCVKGGGEEGSPRGSVHWGCDYITALKIEVDPQRRRFGRRESDLALQILVECRASNPEQVRDVLLRWHSSGSEVCLGLPVGLQKKKMHKFAVHAGGGADNGREKRNFLIVSVLLPIIIDLALRSGASRSCGCVSSPFWCTWLLEPKRSWVMLRPKTKLRLPAWSRR
jgi:hypothetical protein